jgi:hypothetical protein
VITVKRDDTSYKFGICLYAFRVALTIHMLELHRVSTIAGIHSGGNPIEMCLQWSQPEEDNCVHATCTRGPRQTPCAEGRGNQQAPLRIYFGVLCASSNFKILILEVNDEWYLFSETLNGCTYFWLGPTLIISSGADSSERNKIPPNYLSFSAAELVVLHGLKQGDSNLRLQFCRCFLHTSLGGPGLLWLVLWTDEATFMRRGVNSLNNPYELLSEGSLCYSTLFNSWKIWARIVDDCLMGPYMMANRLSGIQCPDFLIVLLEI